MSDIQIAENPTGNTTIRTKTSGDTDPIDQTYDHSSENLNTGTPSNDQLIQQIQNSEFGSANIHNRIDDNLQHDIQFTKSNHQQIDDQIHQYHSQEIDKRPTKKRKNDYNVKKCTRCRVKRSNEPIEQLNKYATCTNCRTKRKVVKNPIDTTLPNTYTDYNAFLNKISTNSTHDIFEHRYKGYSDESLFKRYTLTDNIDSHTYQAVGKQVTDYYINPLMESTGFRFPVRDYHKGGLKDKKLTFMFICSQDRERQRKSKVQNEKISSNNKLKTEYCDSKITLSYSLIDGLVQILYNHKSHPPYVWKRMILKNNGYTTSNHKQSRDQNHQLEHEIGNQNEHQHQNSHTQSHQHQHAQQSQQLQPHHQQESIMTNNDHRELMVDVQTLANFNNLQYQQYQLIKPLENSNQLTDEQRDANTVAVAMAAASQQSKHESPTTVENIDKELIGLSEQ
ncbi:hypothetical protein WICMUC_004185 [Wickerhamomyces mucosus]|uniref:Uncharacterized protein n=1 Tax=Wickerhamomyces mucosus TaxID=1378264 RepID=A0A9P8PK49_9ASCO|nr:hypothetical protein WICMUC_004185 [Wickerhamomyces mucosus]